VKGQIAIVRHGETDWNKTGRLQGREDIPLNETGIGQIEAAAVYLQQSSWDEIVTSPLSRAKKSAEIIAGKTGVKTIREEPGFLERDMGEVSGMTMEERKAAFPKGGFGGMEAPELLQDRVVGALLKYTKEFNGKNFIVVSHGAAINALLAYLSGGELGPGKTMLKNACITLLEYQDEEFHLLFYNKEAREL
jgi:uncharacterized phosphatase